IFIIAWGTDTFAYLTGSLFGKNKLCPKLSPKKTVEGSIGGIIGSIILTLIFVKYYGLFPIWKFFLLAFLGSIIAQLGDLNASKIKRVTGIKDYGFIMPGHGGILDRFDSILFTAPFVYYFVNFFL
ncbi:phosphatidate cytidylyltransferase, partial [Schnuerera sp.]|uniref:phosphatidate cytidylyltransferase n=1 Tax=Schnuerera sp. TaxID=2794844 RepID=UPI002CCE569D